VVARERTNDQLLNSKEKKGKGKSEANPFWKGKNRGIVIFKKHRRTETAQKAGEQSILVTKKIKICNT